MTIANAIKKVVTLKRETTWGEVGTNTGGFDIRRTQANFNLVKENYTSEEIREDQQKAISRHGVRSVDGSINGELSPGSYSDLFSALLARDFTAGVSATALTLTIAANGTNWDITRGSGSFLTSGFKVGDVVRLSGASLNTANVDKNLFVIAVTATVLTVSVLNRLLLVAESAVANCTIAVQGKKTYVPTTGHTDVSYNVEEWFSDKAVSELYVGNKLKSVAVSLPTTGFTTVNFGLVGRDIGQTGTSKYFSSATTVGSTDGLAAVNGALIVDGQVVALVSALDFTVEREVTLLNAVGSNVAADANAGKYNVTGSFSAYFSDTVFRDKFINEEDCALYVALTTNSLANSDVVVFGLPKVQVNSNNRTDDTKGIISTFEFTALLNTAGGSGTSSEKTTIVIQDTQA